MNVCLRGTIFYKMTGSGNDFVVLDGRTTTPDQWPTDRIQTVCDRRAGIGADGMVILIPATPDSIRMIYWNTDGSRAEMCGNAALCCGRLAADLELVAPGTLCLLTDVGPVQVRAQAGGDTAEVSMPDTGLPTPADGIPTAPGEQWMQMVTVGVPHLVVRVDDVGTVDVAARGRQLRFDQRLGAPGANVNFVSAPTAAGEPWRIRTYERGVEDETLACGTGTAASGLALAVAGETQLPVRFRSSGGLDLNVRATLNGARATDIWLGGQSRLVFRGVWEG